MSQSEPAFKTYADTHFVTKAALDRKMNLTAKAIGEAMGDILKPHLDRIADLEAFVALQKAGAAAQELSRKRS